MKKLLSMALVLIMVFSLFAVPTMAATSIEVERVINGDFTAYGENHSLTSDTTASSFGVGSGVTATTVNQDGNIVLALAGNKGSDYRSNKFSYAAGDVYKMSADIYLVAPYGTTDGVDYGRVQFQFGSATAAIDLDGDGVATDHAMDWTNRQYAVNGTTTTLGDDYHTWTQSNLPLNTWIHFEATATLNVDVAENGYFKINLMCDSVPATGPVGYVDNISLKYDEAVYDINVTELNDYGTVVAPASVAETGTADIVITPETGYYPYAVTVNGTNVTDDLVASYVDGYNVKEVWTYTLNGSSLSTDTDVQVTYGYYEMTDMFTGGDAEGETQTIIYKGSTTSVQRVSEPNNGGEYAFKIYYEGTAATMATQHIADAKFAWTAGEKYLVSLDVNIPNKTSNTEVELYGSNNYSLMACGKSNANGKKGWTDIGDGWVTLSTYIDGANSRTSDYITVSFYNVTASENMTVAYMDNYSVKKLTKAGAAPITPVEPPAPEVYDVTITAGANANASVSAATSEGEAVNFTVAPKFGYYIQSITIGGTPFTGFDAYAGGTYSTGTIAADTEIVVTVAELSANTEDGVSTAVATLPAVFAEAGEAPVTFGKVLADIATVDEFGIYLTKGGEGVTSAKTEMGPHFKAFNNINGQYAIEFQGLAAGEYIAKTYVKVAGEITYGIATTFTVAE